MTAKENVIAVLDAAQQAANEALDVYTSNPDYVELPAKGLAWAKIPRGNKVKDIILYFMAKAPSKIGQYRLDAYTLVDDSASWVLFLTYLPPSLDCRIVATQAMVESLRANGINSEILYRQF